MTNRWALAVAARTLFTAMIFAVPLAEAALGQSNPASDKPVAPVDKTDAARVRQEDESRRSWLLENFGKYPDRPVNDPRHVQAVMAEVEQDFKRILILHNELARSLSPGKTLDYDLVSEATGEIRRRAARLQTTLALTKRDDEQNEERHQEFTDAQMRDAVTRLCEQIKSFVTNPIIEQPGTVNAQELAKARHDLQDVIDLSGNLKKSANRLKKTSQ